MFAGTSYITLYKTFIPIAVLKPTEMVGSVLGAAFLS